MPTYKAKDKIHSRVRKPKLSPEERAEVNRANAKNNVRSERVHSKAAVSIDKGVSVDDLMADIYSPKNQYPPEVKIQTAATFIATGGKVLKTAEMMGLSKQCVSDWKNNSEWWDTVVGKLQKEKQKELDAKITNLLEKVFDQVEDRVLNGDEVITRDGERTRKKMSGRELALTGAIMYDKRAMLRGEGALGNKGTSAASILADLRETFREVAKQELDKTVINPEK